MPCTMFARGDHTPAMFICGPGKYQKTCMACCPWCCHEDQRTVHATREVFSGYCAPDMVCGSCGQYWTHDHDRLPRMGEEKRDENIALVQSLCATKVESLVR